MSRLVRRFAPLLVMAAGLGWCSWSQVCEPAPLFTTMDEQELPQLKRQALFPQISEQSQRDPFREVQPEPEPSVEAEPEEAEAEAPAEPPFDPRVVLDSVQLGATMVGTDNPVALINGRVYSEGERIALDGLPNVHCRLQRVLANHVVLKVEKQSLEISSAQSLTNQQQQRRGPQTTPPSEDRPDLIAQPPGIKHAYTKLLELLKSAARDFDLNSSPFETESQKHE